jgi:hypothetical protein
MELLRPDDLNLFKSGGGCNAGEAGRGLARLSDTAFDMGRINIDCGRDLARAGDDGVFLPEVREGTRRTGTGLRSVDGFNGVIVDLIHLSVDVVEGSPVFLLAESVIDETDGERIVDFRLSDLGGTGGLSALALPPHKSTNSCTEDCLALCVFFRRMLLRDETRPSASSGPLSSSDESLESDTPTVLSQGLTADGATGLELTAPVFSPGRSVLAGFFGDIPCVASRGLLNGTGLIDTLALFSGEARKVTCLGIGASAESSPVSQSLGGGNAAVMGDTSFASAAFLRSCSVMLVLSVGESRSPVRFSGDFMETELRCLRMTIGRIGIPSRVSVLLAARSALNSGFASVGILGGGSGRARSCERKDDEDGIR